MDLIILSNELWHLIPATPAMFEGTTKPEIVDCFSLCDILRDKLTTYLDAENKYIMNDKSGLFFGCICQ